jgi:protein SCO1/2
LPAGRESSLPDPVVSQRRPIEWLVWGALISTLIAIAALFAWSRLKPSGPDHTVALPLNYPLPDFTLTNQFGQPVTLAQLRGHVWVADIIFTQCAGPCPVMTAKMSDVQSRLPRSSAVKLVTLTTDPDNDSPEVLKAFGERFNADFSRWSFLTGRKDQIARLAVDGLKLIAIPKNPAERETPVDLFIHSELFVVVDKNATVRAAFESYQPDVLDKVLKAVEQLSREPGS